MKILAPKVETVLRSLTRAGLSPKQASKLLNRTMLCLHYIGAGKRVSVDIFACFHGEVRANGHRLRFNQLLSDAKLIKQTRPHIQSLYSTEYKCKGKAIEQEIKLNKKEAQVMRKVAATHRKTAKADQTLQWLNNSAQHSLEGGLYFSMTHRLGWNCKPFSRLLAGLVAEGLRRKFQLRYFRKSQDSGVLLDHGAEGYKLRKCELSTDFRQVTEVQKFADSLVGEPSTIEDLAELDHGRIERMIKTEEWGWLRGRFLKDIVDAVTKRLRAKEVKLACSHKGLFSPSPEALEIVLVQEVQKHLNVDITRRDCPILTPIYIYNLRRLYAVKHGMPLEQVPRARSLHWEPPIYCTDSGLSPLPRHPFKAGEQILETVQEAKDFYGIDPDTTEGEPITLIEARKQIDRWGSIKASNSEQLYIALEDMLHALPTEPTRQHWELTKAGEEELREKIARFAGLNQQRTSAESPLPSGKFELRILA